MAKFAMLLLPAVAALTALATNPGAENEAVTVEAWGRGGALLYTLTAGTTTLRITDWGATITSLTMLDPRTGKDVDIVLGLDSLEPYMDGTSPYFGAIVGRVANRIKDARFTLNGTTYFLMGNDHNNTLHGGFIGYNNILWRSRVASKDPSSPSVEFLLYSYNTEQGFPGDIDVTVTYTLSGENELRVELIASTRNKMTPVNLAHHSYWNLAGHNSGSILNHTVKILASHYTPVDALLIPTGEIAPVAETPFDFLEPMSIGSRIESVPGGYDHNFALDKTVRDDEGLYHAVTLEDPVSTRKMEIWTNQPGVQFYSGNQIVRIEGKGGAVYSKHAGLCLETQGFPNAVNQPNFPSVILNSGDVYNHVMVHKFSSSL
ncbi:aldose 1-epimerase [Selaginella moellendorffii]|nr:aldose 1-epimerase [Selaginella moellendorffii]|eukprot:XP_002964269.2 aldose 1-epimerase [Selaginella moellendorffii]